MPGLSDMQLEVQTGTQNRPAKLLRTTHGAVCPAEALIGSHCRGKWIAMEGSSGLMVPDVQMLAEAGLGDRVACRPMVNGHLWCLILVHMCYLDIG